MSTAPRADRGQLGWRGAWTLARRGLDWKFRGLRILVVCLVLGVAALAAIGTLTEAVRGELDRRGQAMLGGDVEAEIAGRQAFAAEQAAFARAGRLSIGARMRAMATVPGADGTAVPIELKAIDQAWPLYGTFTLADGRAAGAPNARTAWIAPGVAERLGVATGQSLRIGQATFRIGGVIGDEPDRLGEGFALGPTVIVSRAGLDATGLVQPGAMVRWKYRLRLPASTPAQSVADALTHKFPDAGLELRTRDKASPGLDRFVSRMGQFLALVALAALLIAGIGIGNGVASYLEARRGAIATLKILGATGADIARIYLLQLGLATLLAIAVGLLLGLAATPLIGLALKDLLPIPAGLVLAPRALALAAVQGALIAATFAAPPLLRARAVPAMALMRGRLVPPREGWRARALAMGLGLAAIAAIAVAGAEQPWLAAGFLAAAGGVVALLAGLGWALVRIAARLPRPRAPIARMALANLHRPGAQTGALVTALGFGMAAFVLLAGVQTSLDANIAARVPQRAPDYFVLDVPPAGLPAFRQVVLKAAPSARIRTVPAMRGAIVAFGPPGHMIRVADLARIPDDAWALRGDRGLTFADALPEGNVLTAGRWWPAGYRGEPLVSVDEKLAQAIHLKLGDRITVSLLGVERSARIASFRRIDWDSYGFNYVLVFSPNALADAPYNLAATIELGPDKGKPAVSRAILSGLVRALPSSSVIEVGPVLSQARSILGQMAVAIFAAASVAILAGMAVLAGAISAARAQRQYDAVVLRVLGAGSAQLLLLVLAEQALLALLLGGVALALGTAGAWAVVTQLFDFAWLPGWGTILAVLGGALALVMAMALGGSVGVLRTRPAQALREL
ncbi:ABC transporter permease [Novosphingobium pokkalii]|uniref:ABC transporter permease n=1 Tax=Novosphingobium pokkalii TaxID=1770194 RepID=A0ABV7V539_9SPHN|nr:FtsX-like permease family protein [Novosphingobium pokkalii]GHC89127.1 glycosyl transferase family 1 [Novosphingobium pokkalii]